MLIRWWANKIIIRRTQRMCKVLPLCNQSPSRSTPNKNLKGKDSSPRPTPRTPLTMTTPNAGMRERRRGARCNEVLGIVTQITLETLQGRTIVAMTAGSGSWRRASVPCSRTATILSRSSAGKVHKRRIKTLQKVTLTSSIPKRRADNSRDKTAMNGLKRRHWKWNNSSETWIRVQTCKTLWLKESTDAIALKGMALLLRQTPAKSQYLLKRTHPCVIITTSPVINFLAAQTALGNNRIVCPGNQTSQRSAKLIIQTLKLRRQPLVLIWLWIQAWCKSQYFRPRVQGADPSRSLSDLSIWEHRRPVASPMGPSARCKLIIRAVFHLWSINPQTMLWSVLPSRTKSS